MEVRLSLPTILRPVLLATLILTVCSLALAQPAPSALVTQAVDNSVRTSLPGNVHPLARAEFDRGEAPIDMPLKRMLLVLKRSPEQAAALRKLIDHQQDKSSPDYHKWVTPEEFGVRFGLSDQDLSAVANWLTASGFEVTQVSKGRTVIEFSGTAGLVKQAFGTAIHKFEAKGEEHWANVNDPSIPTALAPVVAGVNSLHNFQKKAQNKNLGTFSRDNKTGQVTPRSPQFTFNAGCFPIGQNCNAVGPYDFATIYDLLPLWNAGTTGAGQRIAIVGRTNINPQDATDFWNLFGLTVPSNKLNIILNGPDPGINGDEGEADIDIQWSGAVAPGAFIDFVTSASTETTDGVDLSALYIVNNNVAPVMSESYGQCELAMGNAGVSFYSFLWEQAAAQGISAFVSSGDNGGAGCDNPGSPAQFGLNVNGLASTQFNTAVGGTDFNQYNKWSTYWNTSNDLHQASAKSYIPETTWNDTCTNNFFVVFGGFGSNAEAVCNNATIIQENFVNSVAGSGGNSLAWAKPSWQTGTPSDNARDLPDISLFSGDGFVGSFYIVCQSNSSPSGTCDLNSPFTDFAGFGGTSVASPAFAGIMALVNQKWGVQGNPNFVLYKLPAKQANAFHDIPSGSTIAVACLTGSPNCATQTQGHQFGVLSGFNTGTAYDLATGLGSVDATNMVNNWNLVTFTASTTTLTLNSGNPVNVTHGATVPVTVSVSPTAATGNVALLVSPGAPGNAGIDFNTLATGGAVTWSTNLLPGGTYKVIAHYEGDTIRGGSYSAPSANVTVNPENSSVLMPGVVTATDGNGNPVYSTSVPYGSAYLLRADVLNAQGKLCTTETLGQIACPTGTVAFTDNSSPLDAGTYKLNSFGYTEDGAIQLTGGSHTLAANYSGDNSYNASAQTQAITVTKATTNISVTAPASAEPGQAFTTTAAVSATSSGLAPTGTVSFFANGTALPGTVQYSPVNGGPSNNASLSASLSTSISTFGNYTITATYSGDTNYATSASSNQVPIVIPPFNISPNNVTISAGQSGTASVTLSPLGGFTGQVTIQCTLPANMLEATCPSVNTTIADANPVTASVVITTTGPHQVAAIVPIGKGLYVFGVFAGIFLATIPGLRRKRLPLAFLLLMAVAMIASCGGGGGGTHTDPGTPKGTYTVNLSATGANTTVPASFSVTVQ
jgi:hypothetical protein